MAHIRNYVVLEGDEDGVTITIRDHEDVSRQITDPVTKQPKTVQATELILESADGRPTDARMSILSDRLYALFSPYLRDKSYRGKRFHVQATGTGFRREYSLRVLP